jgi:hypothetical protein
MFFKIKTKTFSVFISLKKKKKEENDTKGGLIF